jgi:hypothetical protein
LVGLKRKPLFHFRENFRLRENFRFRESFRENVRFREKFLFPGWFSRKLDLATHSSGSWIQIRIPNGKFSRKLSQNLKFSRNLSRKRKFSRKFSQLFVIFFREKRKNIFAKFSRKYENENFRFNPNLWSYYLRPNRKTQRHHASAPRSTGYRTLFIMDLDPTSKNILLIWLRIRP